MQNEVDISLVDLNLGRAVISSTLTGSPVLGKTYSPLYYYFLYSKKHLSQFWSSLILIWIKLLAQPRTSEGIDGRLLEIFSKLESSGNAKIWY